jgi:uncharacterized membrane protein
MQKRIQYIDSLRGLAVIFMVQQHILFWTWEKHWLSFSLTFPEHPVMLSLYFAGSFAAPLFLMLAGAGAVFLYRGQSPSAAEYFKRGLFILLCGYLLNFLAWQWFRHGSWYVLHTIGIAIMLFPVLNRFSSVKLILLSIAALLLSALIQTWLKTPLMLGNIYMNDTSMNGGMLRLAFAEGHFPIFPWIGFFLMGVVSGRWLAEGKRINLLIACMAAAFTGCVLAWCYHYGFFFATGGRLFRMFVWSPVIFPPMPPLMLVLAGCAFLFMFIFSGIRTGGSKIFPALESTGRLSLSWFLIHVVIFKGPLRFAVIDKSLDSFFSFVFTETVVVLIIFISVLWSRKGYSFSMEWLMRKVIKLL